MTKQSAASAARTIASLKLSPVVSVVNIGSDLSFIPATLSLLDERPNWQAALVIGRGNYKTFTIRTIANPGTSVLYRRSHR
jgi:hypothetical protein